MPHFKDHFINECMKILKKEEVKNELKALMRPMIDMILIEIYPHYSLMPKLEILSKKSL